MTFEVVKQINLIDAMKVSMKPNFNICMEEHSMIHKKLHDKRVTIMNNKLEIYGAFRHKTTLR